MHLLCVCSGLCDPGVEFRFLAFPAVLYLLSATGGEIRVFFAFSYLEMFMLSFLYMYIYLICQFISFANQFMKISILFNLKKISIVISVTISSVLASTPLFRSSMKLLQTLLKLADVLFPVGA